MAVVGARDHSNPHQVQVEINQLPAETVVVSGGARGIDRVAVTLAKHRGLQTIELKADWSEGDNKAGLRRNHDVLACVDEVIAFPWWGCTGTLHTIREGRKLGLPVTVVKPITHLEVWTASMRGANDPDFLDITASADNKAAPATEANVRALLRFARERCGPMGARDIQRAATRAKLPSLGAAWTPPGSLLATALARRQALKASSLDDAAKVREEDVLWSAYRDGESGRLGFMEALRASYRDRTMAKLWGWAFGRERLVLGCFCQAPPWWPGGRPFDHCHRFLVARAFEACGATYTGELF